MCLLIQRRTDERRFFFTFFTHTKEDGRNTCFSFHRSDDFKINAIRIIWHFSRELDYDFAYTELPTKHSKDGITILRPTESRPTPAIYIFESLLGVPLTVDLLSTLYESPLCVLPKVDLLFDHHTI